MATLNIFLLTENMIPGRQALMTAFSPTDHFLIGEHWYTGEDSWQHGTGVECVRKNMMVAFPQFAIGDTLYSKNLDETHEATCLIEHIEMFELAYMDAALLSRLGDYADLADYRAKTAGWKYATRGWLVHITPMEVTQLED